MNSYISIPYLLAAEQKNFDRINCLEIVRGLVTSAEPIPVALYAERLSLRNDRIPFVAASLLSRF